MAAVTPLEEKDKIQITGFSKTHQEDQSKAIVIKASELFSNRSQLLFCISCCFNGNLNKKVTSILLNNNHMLITNTHVLELFNEMEAWKKKSENSEIVHGLWIWP